MKDTGEVFQRPHMRPDSNGDPLQVSSAFTTTSLPGINNTDLANAVALYNLLTGRVVVELYQSRKPRHAEARRLYQLHLHRLEDGRRLSDRWRFKKNLTLNYGLRWEVQGPMHDLKGITAADLASV